MERLRRENDIDILWEIVAGGNDSNIPYDLTGKNLKVFMINAYERVAVNNFKVEGNTISWRYLGKDQQRRGIYSLLLIENEGEEGMHTVDECKAFELVDCSCMEGGEAESHVRIETIRLKSGISVNSIVPDKKLDVDSGNVVENAAIAKEFQRVDEDIEGVSDALENQGREIANLGETLSEHGDALDVLNGEGEGSVKKTVADEVARIVADAPEGYDTLKEIADYIASDKTGAAQINNTLDAHGKAISAIEKKNTEQDTAIGKKAEQDGVYPDMTVGLAEDLGGRPYYDDAEFSFRASAGSDTSIKDGMARIKELRGNSVVWNQSVQNPSEVYTNDTTVAFKEGTRIVVGHKYLFFADIESAISYASASVFSKINEQNESLVTLYKSENLPYKFFVANANAVSNGTDQAIEGNIWLYYHLGTSGGQIQNTRLIDLTLMFGAGNEPVTIDEFYARMPIGVDMSAYNEGEVIHMAADGIKSVGDNAWDEEWNYNGSYVEGVNPVRVLPNAEYYVSSPDYVVISVYDKNGTLLATHERKNNAFTTSANASYLRLRVSSSYGTTYNNDIMISLVHSGWKQDTDAKYQPYWDDRLLIDQRIKDAFPEGLQKWDKVFNKNGKGYIVKGTGKVDMGSLNWGFFNDVYYAGVSNKVIGEFERIDVLCARYSAISGGSSGEEKDGDIWGEYSTTNVFVKDSAYTDAASFKSAMAGVPLYYELATPEVIEYDEPFNLDYRVADFGTEEVISDQPSAPIAAEIQYNFNANDTIRTNRIAIRDMHREIAELRAMISAMQVQLTNKEGEA